MNIHTLLHQASITGMNAILVVGLGTTSVQSAVINFDTDAYGNPINAPSVFRNTTRLTELYAPLGVHFNGPGGNDGGAILAQSGNFGVSALSGSNFLAFNRRARLADTGVPRDPQTINFDTPLNSLSMFAASGNNTATFKLEAFDMNNSLVGSNTVTTQPGVYGKLRVASASGNISEIVLSSEDTDYFVVDDLSFTAVPEPSGVLGTLALSSLGTVYLLKRKLKKQKSIKTTI